MNLKVQTMTFDGAVLNRGYWLYLWRITSGANLFIYVGRTGDSSSNNAGSPFTRIGNHLDSRPTAKGNSLWKQLTKEKVNPQKCNFEMTAIGPIFPEEKETTKHRERRDQMAALEREISNYLKTSGFKVLGVHHSNKRNDQNLIDSVINVINERFKL